MKCNKQKPVLKIVKSDITRVAKALAEAHATSDWKYYTGYARCAIEAYLSPKVPKVKP